MKTKKSLIEKVFIYPSFNLRFWLSVAVLIVVFAIITKLALAFATNKDDIYQTLNLIIQVAMLVAGVIAAYFALRQLTESRYLNLTELGMQYLRRNPPGYSKSIQVWKEALYIQAEPNTFLNLAEVLVISEQFSDFDQYVSYVEKNSSFQHRVLQESSDYLIFYYLQAIRQLIVKNMGEAETKTKQLVAWVKSENLTQRVNWQFVDFTRSESYQKKLIGDHKTMTDNIIKYLSRELTPEQISKFESGNYLLSE